MATANALAAIIAGADGLDVTVNGLGDRAGNTSLEQIAILLFLRGYKTEIDLQALLPLSRAVARYSGIKNHPLAPVVGDFVFSQRSPAHQECPQQFTAFTPELLGL